jgi:hypothetical protein
LVSRVASREAFFEALTFLAHDGGRREIYSEVGTRYVVFSKTPIERKPRTAPKQQDLFGE